MKELKNPALYEKVIWVSTLLLQIFSKTQIYFWIKKL